MPRYTYTPIFNNNIEFYEFLRKKRNNLKNIVQYETQVMRNPTLDDRVRLVTDAHLWSYGDRFYKMAHQYYGDVNYWWVIAWYNGYMTESAVFPGDVIQIPVDLEQALVTLGSY
tara:strand:+ start:106 stop:447 length:342 start_codon:yes stop_codon:yes gene_type:complete